MRDKTKELCVLGGGYFTLGYFFNLIRNFLEELPTYRFMGVCFNSLSGLLDIAFIILFLMCLIKQQNLVFLRGFINKFPKTSVYLFYIGICGYILLVIDCLLLLPLYFSSINKMIEKYLTNALAIINIGGVLIALILATLKVFLKSIGNRDGR